MELARVFNGKKYMWDGKVYPDLKESEKVSQEYQDDGFEVELLEEADQYFVFTRRVVTEIVVVR